MTTKNSSPPISRRQFLRGAAATSGVLLLPSGVFGRNASSPNSKLNIAGIGLGSRGAVLLRDHFNGENIVALSDVDAKKAATTFKRFPQARRYEDFRMMLDKEKSIDAVVVATPDHTHAVAAMMAIKMGKHVYCEKPLTHTVWEARQLTRAAREHRVQTQMGNQGQASEETRRLCELVWADAIGPVREVHIWTDRPARGLFTRYWPQGIERPEETVAVPDTLNWDLWLGPAPERPYHPIYVPHDWRGWWDFGTGALGDMGCHTFDPVFRALKLGHPITIEARSTPVNEETYPLASTVTYQFPARDKMPPVTLHWYDGGLRPPRPKELEDGKEMGLSGRLLIGDKGVILNSRMLPESRDKEYGDPPRVLPRSIGHHAEWLEACRGGKPAGSNFDWAGPLTEVVLLGNVALRPQLRVAETMRKLEWDGPALKFTNVSKANEFLQTTYRNGWNL
ncbi:MAG TPA: Gfo/Idh/MocA family oxidoreductase [Verrucomicrobiae bacterium]|nr:Gfo/Idh/MocA family oxidoreductase [Verrucomicrobiae bacterium]